MAESIGQQPAYKDRKGLYRYKGANFANATVGLTPEQVQQVPEGERHSYYNEATGDYMSGVVAVGNDGKKSITYSKLDPNAEDFTATLGQSVKKGFNPVTGTFDTEENAISEGKYNPSDYLTAVPADFGAQVYRSSIVENSPTYTDFSKQTAAQYQKNAAKWQKDLKKATERAVKEIYDRRALKDLGMKRSDRVDYHKKLKQAYSDKNSSNSLLNMGKAYAQSAAKNYTEAYNAWKNTQGISTQGYDATQSANTANTTNTAATSSSGSTQTLPTNWTINLAGTPVNPYGPAPTFTQMPTQKAGGGVVNYAKFFSLGY